MRYDVRARVPPRWLLPVLEISISPRRLVKGNKKSPTYDITLRKRRSYWAYFLMIMRYGLRAWLSCSVTKERYPIGYPHLVWLHLLIFAN